MYLAAKHSHLTFVLLSVVLFYFRYFQYQIRGKELPKILKVLPHVIDTLLLVSALILCFIISQYPFTVAWLTYKIVFVIGYIGLAAAAMKTTSKKQSIGFLSGASICLVLAAKFAVTKGAF